MVVSEDSAGRRMPFGFLQALHRQVSTLTPSYRFNNRELICSSSGDSSRRVIRIVKIYRLMVRIVLGKK